MIAYWSSLLVVIMSCTVVLGLASPIGPIYSDSNQPNVTHPFVFNAFFYVNNNPDLTDHGIYTPEAAQMHWVEHGIAEGRQGSGEFHVLQYFSRYPDVAKSCNNNHTQGILHYLTRGRQAGMRGFVKNGASFGRYTIGNPGTGIFISASNRTAGAVDSLIVNGTELINSWDHGRELQMAVTTIHGECYNPTEAGNRDDLRQSTTTSLLTQAVTSVNEETLTTTVYPAFWMQPGEHHANPNANCSVALNKQLVSNYVMRKNVTMAALGLPNAVLYEAAVSIPEDQPRVQIESPTGYHNSYLNTFYFFVPNNGSLVGPLQCPVNQGCPPPSQPPNDYPLVLSTSDGSVAIGAYSALGVSGSGYVRFYFQESEPTDTTSKWTILRVYEGVSAGSVLPVRTFLCLGALDDVHACMQKVASSEM